MDKPTEVTAFYNGACPVCRAGMTGYDSEARDQGLPLAFCDVARQAGPAAALGITPEAALRRLHAVDAQGRLYRGFDAMLLVWRGMPRHRWLARLCGLPVIRPLAAWVYEHVVSWGLYRWSRHRLADQAGARRA